MPTTKTKVCLVLYLVSLAVVAIVGSRVGETTMSLPEENRIDIIALELNPAECCTQLLKNPAVTEAVKESLRLDSHFFIPAYTIFFIALGLSVFCSLGSAWPLGIVIVSLAVFASGCDFLENHYLYLFVDGQVDQQIIAGHVRGWSLIKWTLSFLVGAATAPLFLLRGDWTRTVGVLLLLAGLSGVGGLYRFEVVYYTLPLLGLGFLLVGITFILDLLLPRYWVRHW